MDKIVDILLVEDNSGDRKLTEIAFKKAKIANTLYMVEDGEEALDFLYKRNQHKDVPTPDLVLLDLNLPKISGIEILEICKTDSGLSTIPIIVLTTSDAESDILKSYKLHANSYCTKPVDFSKFMKVVRGIETFWLQLVKLPPK